MNYVIFSSKKKLKQRKNELIRRLDENPVRLRDILHILSRGTLLNLLKEEKIQKYRIEKMNISIYYTTKSEHKLPLAIIKAMKENRRKKRNKNTVIKELVENFEITKKEEMNIRKHLHYGTKLELGDKYERIVRLIGGD